MYNEMLPIISLLPEYSRIGKPKQAFQAAKDGYNMNSLFRSCEDFRGDFAFCLLLIETTSFQVFGAFIDDVFFTKPKSGRYIGSKDCFVFTVKPDLRVFHDKEKNQRHLLQELNYFSIGGGGEGAAIRVNEMLDYGYTEKSETYGNELLTLG